MSIEELHALFLQHPVVTTDSRKCPLGSIFFALKGEKFDGNQFVSKALENGCSYAVIDNPEYSSGERTILVDNVLKTLQELACYHRSQLHIPVIGITGTNGKTTTKELISAVLRKRYNVLYTEGNYNNSIGVPLTLLRLNAEHEIAVIEMGASHPGDIKELVEIAKPDFGLITNVGRAHLEGFGSFEGVIKTKGELYDFIRSVSGTIFIDKDNLHLVMMSHGINQITYGSDGTASVNGLVVECNPYLIFIWGQGDNRSVVKTHLIGSYNLGNVLSAVTVGLRFGVKVEDINLAIEEYVPSNNRSQLMKTERNTLIIDAYNANPSSMKAALDNFKAQKISPKAVILGDMMELGPDSDNLHEETLSQIVGAHFDKVFLCGSHFSKVAANNPSVETYETTETLMAALEAKPLSGCNILIKGSHSMGLERIVPLL